jgi:hypothetical protein
MSTNTNNVKAQLEDQYAREEPTVKKGDEIPPPTLYNCNY